MQKFYMVLADNSNYTSYRHPTEAAAQAEADRLAKSRPGTLFHVLSAFEGYQYPVVPTGLIKYEDDLPF